MEACTKQIDPRGPTPRGPLRKTDGLRAGPERTERIVRAAVRSGLVGPGHVVAGFIDADGVRASVRHLQAAFAGTSVLHAFAVKAASLVPVLRLLGMAGMGCEAAGPGELAQALAAGVAPERVVLDSPAKTIPELTQALALGVAVNADNFAELERIQTLLAGRACASVLGLRVNPQVGSGTIEAMSTASAVSKFGVPLRDAGARARVRDAFRRFPWLSRIHVHVGSQGCPLELMADGVRAAYELAEEINEMLGRRQVTSLDIGGGLPVNFDDDQVRPTFHEYADQLRARVPGLFDGRYGLVTEFGRALVAKSGFIAAVVEYTKDVGGRRIVLTHAGAQVATRTVLMPDAWPLRVSVYDAQGRAKQGPSLVQDIAGPCCFAGDVVARGRALPELEPGDIVVLHDTGGYYFSTPWAYNSLTRPGVHGFTTQPPGVRFATIRAEQSLAELLTETGADRAEALAQLGDPRGQVDPDGASDLTAASVPATVPTDIPPSASALGTCSCH